MEFTTDNENRLSAHAAALALDPYSPVVPTSVRTAPAADPLGLDPYSPIVGPVHRADPEATAKSAASAI